MSTQKARGEHAESIEGARDDHGRTDDQRWSPPGDLPPYRKALVMDEIRDRLWSVQDVADFLGIPPRMLYSWRCRGVRPRARRVGRYLRYEEQEVRTWFISQSDAVP